MYHVPVFPYEMSNTNVQPMLSHHRVFFSERYKPLNFDGIQGFPNPVPIGVKEQLSGFNGKRSESTQQYLQEFFELMEDFEINQEDVFMKLFVQSLRENDRDWFSYMPICSISSWDELKVAFIEQFSEIINPSSVMKTFMDFQKEDDELVPSFNLRFCQGIG